ncbi:hypothetical protein BDR22DRAFT_215606 [Usnea florida]
MFEFSYSNSSVPLYLYERLSPSFASLIASRRTCTIPMATYNAISARYEELRSPNPLPSTNSTGNTTPARYSGSFMQTQSQPFNDSRGGLQRRQTTDLGKVAGITPIGQQPTQAVDPLDLSMTFHTAQLVSKPSLQSNHVLDPLWGLII